MSDPESPRTLWPQVVSLGLLNAAMGLAWLAYQLYLPSLLTSAGLAASVAATVLLIEAMLAVVLEPLFGLGSDVTFRRLGTRWPLIVLGCLLSVALLISIPAFVLEPAQRDGRLRLVLVGLLLAWAMAMAVCRTPVLALLARYSSPASLPQAAAVLTLFSAAVAALRPGAKEFILGLGPMLCFLLASAVMLGSMALLQFIDSGVEAVEPEPADPFPSDKLKIGLIALTGAAFGVANKVAFGEVLPRVLDTLYDSTRRDRVLVGVFVVLALASLATGALARKVGNNRVLIFAAGLCGAELLVLTNMKGEPMILAAIAVFVLIYSCVANGAIPFVMARVPHGRGGLGLGFWFGGLAGGVALFNWLVPQPATLTLPQLAQVGLGAFLLIAGVTLQTSRQ